MMNSIKRYIQSSKLGQCLVFSKGILIGFVLGLLAVHLLAPSFEYTSLNINELSQQPTVFQIADQPVTLETKRDRIRILCWVTTSPKTHSRAQLIKDTWGRRCDKLLFMSSIQGISLFTVFAVSIVLYKLFISKNYYRRYATGCNYPADSE